MKEQFVETWRINNRVNLKLLESIRDEGLYLTLSPRGGGTPAKQFAHIHNVRFWKLERLAPDLAEKQTKISLKETLTYELLRYRIVESSGAIEMLLERTIENGNILKGFKRGVAPFLGYLISHEAHHRGNMLLTLKQCGYTLPKSVTYGIWDWNKI